MALFLLVPALSLGALSPSQPSPSGLTVDWQTAPALGVSIAPRFGWSVAPCSGSKNAMQSGYTIQVSADGASAKPVWDSGKVMSNSSFNVKYGGPALVGGAAYIWTVKTMSGSCTSAASAPATFITALGSFHPDAKWIGAGVSNATFNLARRVVTAPPKSSVRRVIGFITAQNSLPTMLMNYKLYINGVLASAGPGRGEAPVLGGDGRFRAQPYVTVDLTELMPVAGGKVVLALQTMEFGGVDPCPPGKECNGATQVANGPAVLMQIDVHPASGAATTTWVTEASTWKAMDADAWFRPKNVGLSATESGGKKDGPGGNRGQACVLRESRPFYGKPCEPDTDPALGSGSAGSGRMEFTDARMEPVGWQETSFDDAKWPAAVAISTPTLTAAELTPRMAGPAVMIIPELKPVRVGPFTPDGHRNSVYGALGPSPSGFFVDFGKEFQGGAWSRTPTTRCGHSDPPNPLHPLSLRKVPGLLHLGPAGLRLKVTGGKAGQTVKFNSGEMCTPMTTTVSGGGRNVSNPSKCTDVEQDWQWMFTWTLRDGDQMIEQHQYMEFRYLNVVFDGPPPADWSVSAWGVQAPWDPTDTHFGAGTSKTWTVLQNDGPNHLGLRCNALPAHQMALITSGCVPFRVLQPDARRSLAAFFLHAAGRGDRHVRRLQHPGAPPV